MVLKKPKQLLSESVLSVLVEKHHPVSHRVSKYIRIKYVGVGVGIVCARALLVNSTNYSTSSDKKTLSKIAGEKVC